MPQEVIPILRVSDATRSVEWYARLGFSFEWEHRFGDGFPAFVSVASGHARMYLSEHDGDATPDTLVYLRHGGLDGLAREFATEITVVPWGRELHLTDPDGNRLRVSDPTDD